MKVRAQTAPGSRITCPVCKSPVALPNAGDNQSPEFRPTLPDPVVPRSEALPRHQQTQEPDVEFTPTLGNSPPAQRSTDIPADDEDGFLNALKPTSDHHSGKHIRVKKRRTKSHKGHRDELTDWNTVNMDSLPEAEIYSDPWLAPVPIPEEVVSEHTKDYVVSEFDEDGRKVKRIKRVKKRRLITLARLFFRRLSMGMRIVTVTIVTAIGVLGMWYAIKVFRQKFAPVTFEEVVAEQRPDRVFLSSQDENGAAEVLSAFLAASGPQEKLAYVRLPNRVKPMMEAWYAKHPDKPATAGEIRTRTKMRAGENYFVILELDVTEPNPVDPALQRKVTRSFAVEEFEKADSSRSYKVDWETAVEWRPMSFGEFKQQQPRNPVPFRIKIRGSGYYNHLFTDEEKWLSAELYYPYPEGQNEFVFYGYIDRKGPAFRDLEIYTMPDNNASLILGLRYPDNPVSRDQVIIDSLVHPSWFFSEDKPPEEFASPSPQ